jgi:hypothetical protein
MSYRGNFQEMDPQVYVQSLFDTSTTQKQKLGTTRRLSDGREFIYGKAGAANLVAGVLCQGPVHDVANHGNLAIAANVTAAANAKAVTVTLSDLAATANMYKEGFLHINTGANAIGDLYKVLSNPAANANASCVITLYDAIRTTLLAATHKATLCKHPFDGLIIHPSPPTQAPVGVTLVDVLANNYAWFQRRGPAPVLANGTLVAGQVVMPSEAVDGAVSPVNNAYAANVVPGVLLPVVGRVLTVNANAHVALIDLIL